MLEIELFKFDSQTDYLPYYKNYRLKRDNLRTIDDVLNEVHKIEKFGRLEDETFFVRANGTFTDTTGTLDTLLKDSQTLRIEPISVKRAVNDLIIDTKDYKQKLELLAPYLTDIQEMISEKTYMLEYYASNTLHFKDDYIGEHVILLVSDILKELPMLQEELHQLIDCEEGLKHRSSLAYRIQNENTPQNADTVKIPNIIQSFENFNIALYCALNAPSFENVIKESNAQYLDLASKHFDIPENSKELSYLMAGTVLLEALDNNADFLIVNNKEELALFDGQQKAIGKTMGREISLPVVTQGEFIQLLEGDKNIPSHKIKLSFLD
ncbi:MAG: hypothetical protein H8E76_07355 [Helicobacteraceae bacterium]|nr:hypothetical protein [Candidatus Sulfurimonas ponti]